MEEITSRSLFGNYAKASHIQPVLKEQKVADTFL